LNRELPATFERDGIDVIIIKAEDNVAIPTPRIAFRIIRILASVGSLKAWRHCPNNESVSINGKGNEKNMPTVTAIQHQNGNAGPCPSMQ
jgi:hypothetical protein